MGFLSLLKDQRDKGLRERNPITRLLRERYRPNRAHRPIAHVNERCLCPENRKDKGRALLAIRVTLSDAFLYAHALSRTGYLFVLRPFQARH